MRPARCGPQPANSGFTLVEVLVALVIMAVLAAMGWQGVSAMVRSREISTAASERTLRLSALVGQWEQDLAEIYDSTQVPGISFDGASVRIVRRVDAGVQLVVWSLREGQWRRWPGPVSRRSGELQQAWLASQQLQGNEPGQLLLVDGVSAWQLYFWRGQGWSNAQSSADLAVSTVVQQRQTAAPPPADAAGNPEAGAREPATGTGGAGGGAPPNTAVVVQRSLLPTGVRLQLDLPEGRLLRDVMLSPTAQ